MCILGCAKSPLESSAFLSLDPETLFISVERASQKGAIQKKTKREFAAAEGAGKNPAPPGVPDQNQQIAGPPNSKKIIHGSVYGTGRLLHSESLSGVRSKEYYLVRASLRGSGSRLRLHSHFTGFRREDGVQVEFLRLGQALKIHASAQQLPKRALYEDSGYFAFSPEIDFTLSVQNGSNSMIRIQIWNNHINRSGVLKAKAGFLRTENLLVDTFEKGMGFYSHGEGSRWGIHLNMAELIKGARISPRKLLSGFGMEMAESAD